MMGKRRMFLRIHIRILPVATSADPPFTKAPQGCPSSITVGSETVACVDQFTYIGSTIDSSGKSEPEIRRRITIAKSAMQQAYKSVWNAHIALSTKLRLYNTCILPNVLYASESWADVALLDAFDQWCLRHILGFT